MKQCWNDGVCTTLLVFDYNASQGQGAIIYRRTCWMLDGSIEYVSKVFFNTTLLVNL